jgi:hypothetical protein
VCDQGRESGIPTIVVIDRNGEVLRKIRIEDDGLSGLNEWKFEEWRW